MHSDQPLKAAVMILGASFLFACMGALIKTVTITLPNEMVVFFRNAVGLAALLPWLIAGGVRALRTQYWRLHCLRSLAGLAAMYCFFYAISTLPLATAVLLNYSAPLFVPIIAALWLKEPFPLQLRIAAISGFVGIALILKPGATFIDPAALVGLTAGLLTAIAFVGIRRLSSTEPTIRIVFYFGLISTIVSAVPLAWSWTPPPPAHWGLLMLIGMLATAAQLLLTRAYSYASAARVGPFGYSMVVFAALLGWLFWNETLDVWDAGGTLLVCLAGMATLWNAPKKLPVT